MEPKVQSSMTSHFVISTRLSLQHQYQIRKNRQKLPMPSKGTVFIAHTCPQGSQKLQLPEIPSEHKLRQELPMDWQ
ncbi:MAG: hypothetical protein ACK6D0_01135 [Planctomyces sp.]